jgi:hypothetical protein
MDPLLPSIETRVCHVEVGGWLRRRPWSSGTTDTPSMSAGDVGGPDRGADADRARVVADDCSGSCLAAAARVVAVAGVPVDRGDDGVFGVRRVNPVGRRVGRDADGTKAGGGGGGDLASRSTSWPLRVLLLITDTVPAVSPSAMFAV